MTAEFDFSMKLPYPNSHHNIVTAPSNGSLLLPEMNKQGRAIKSYSHLTDGGKGNKNY